MEKKIETEASSYTVQFFSYTYTNLLGVCDFQEMTRPAEQTTGEKQNPSKTQWAARFQLFLGTFFKPSLGHY